MRERYLAHLTLATGHVHRSVLAECDPAQITIAAQQLAEALTLPEAAIQDGCTLRAGATGKALLATVYGQVEGHPVPLATIAVATSGRASPLAWREITKSVDHALPMSRVVREPDPPWCAVRLYTTIEVAPDAVTWLGAYEKCLAWAWVDGRAGAPRR